MSLINVKSTPVLFSFLPSKNFFSSVLLVFYVESTNLEISTETRLMLYFLYKLLHQFNILHKHNRIVVPLFLDEKGRERENIMLDNERLVSTTKSYKLDFSEASRRFLFHLHRSTQKIIIN